MSYNNFIPTFWANEIQRERERLCVAARLCNTEYEGEIRQQGDKVKIYGVTRPTIVDYTKNTTELNFETLPDMSTLLEISQARAFAFKVDDIDKRQASGNIMSAQMKEAAAAQAEACDSWLYKYVLKPGAGKEIDCTNLSHATVFSKLLEAFTYLWENNVPQGEEIYIEASPKLMAKILLAKIVFGSPNDKTIDNGLQGSVTGLLNSKLYLANGVYNDGTYDYCIVRTKMACAFASQMTEVEALRPEKSFSDAVKGLHLFGGQMVRPKECVRLKCSYAAETTI